MTRLRIGFVPLVDAANIIVAARKGFAENEGLTLELSRERSWASIRDKLSVGYLDAAHVLSPMVVASHLGMANFSSTLMAPTMLSLDGNEMTLSQSLVDLCGGMIGYTANGPEEWGGAVARVVREGAAKTDEPLNFACVFPFSSHAYLLREWLSGAGLDPRRDVTVSVLPPAMMADALREGSIDGFCAGPPWGRLAQERGAGKVAFRMVRLRSGVPEKALALRAVDPLRDKHTVISLVRAIVRASQWVADESNATELFDLLAQPDAVGVAANTIATAVDRSGMRLSGHDILRPQPDHAAWIVEQMQRWTPTLHADSLQADTLFRSDIYDMAVAGMPKS